jgi:two-component system, OmpR family, response regulator
MLCVVSCPSMDGISQLKVFVVDDDTEIRALLVSYLSSQGMAVTEVGSEAELLSQMRVTAADVILLDVNLGTEDGFSIARRLRENWHGGLIMLTGRGDTIDRVVGLEIGADDYVSKPFDLRELLARIRSVGRRSVKEEKSQHSEPPKCVANRKQFRFERFSLTVEARELRDDEGQVIALTSGEFNLLVALVENQGRVLSRDALLQLTHRREAAPFDRTIDVQIGRLRKKLGDDSSLPKIIKSVRGEGYLFALKVKEEL